jgi:hypothetical protein
MEEAKDRTRCLATAEDLQLTGIADKVFQQWPRLVFPLKKRPKMSEWPKKTEYLYLWYLLNELEDITKRGLEFFFVNCMITRRKMADNYNKKSCSQQQKKTIVGQSKEAPSGKLL